MALDLSNPNVAWVGVWLFALGLTALKLTSNIVELTPDVLFLVFANVISAFVFFVVSRGALQSPPDFNDVGGELVVIDRFLKYLLGFWLIGTCVDVLYSGGLPIFWAAFDIDRDYTQFGVPSFHGVVNACYMFSVTIISLKVFLSKGNGKYFLLLMLSWPILMLGRGILLSALMQIAAVYLVINKVSLKSLLRLCFVILLNIIIFGVIGNYRGTSNPFGYLLEDQSSIDLFSALPDGFLWFYVYVTAGLNNVAFGLDGLEPLYYPFYTFLNLIPSIWRVGMDGYVINASLIPLVDENLNTSTFYSGYLSDFGIIGGFLGGLLLQVLSTYLYFCAKQGNLGAILGYSVIFQCVVFSVFYDMFFLLPYLLQLAMAAYLIKATRLNYRRNYE